jgi:hypothetical protein
MQSWCAANQQPESIEFGSEADLEKAQEGRD